MLGPKLTDIKISSSPKSDELRMACDDQGITLLQSQHTGCLDRSGFGVCLLSFVIDHKLNTRALNH